MQLPRGRPRRPSRAATMTAGRNLINVVGTLLLVALVVPFLIYGFPQVVGAEESYIVASGSMEPTLEPADVVLVYHVDPGEIAVGDVITFRTQGSTFPTTHRVTEVVPTNDFDSGVGFRTKGDANPDVDAALLPGSQVIGRVPVLSIPGVWTGLVHLPMLGHVVQFVNTPLGFVLLFVLPILLFVLNEGWLLVGTAAERTRSAATGTSRTSDSDGGILSDGGHVLIGSNPTTGLVLSRRQLTLAMAGFGLGALAVGWFAIRDPSPLTVALTVACLGGVVFSAGLRRAAGRAPAITEPIPIDPDRVVRARLPAELAVLPRVVLESPEELFAHASALDRYVLEDEETGAYFLPDDVCVYTVASEEVSGNGTGPASVTVPEAES